MIRECSTDVLGGSIDDIMPQILITAYDKDVSAEDKGFEGELLEREEVALLASFFLK